MRAPGTALRPTSARVPVPRVLSAVTRALWSSARHARPSLRRSARPRPPGAPRPSGSIRRPPWRCVIHRPLSPDPRVVPSDPIARSRPSAARPAPVNPASTPPPASGLALLLSTVSRRRGKAPHLFASQIKFDQPAHPPPPPAATTDRTRVRRAPSTRVIPTSARATAPRNLKPSRSPSHARSSD